MVKKLSVMILAALAASLLWATVAPALERGETLDRGLQNNDSYAGSLVARSAEAMGDEKKALLEQAVLHAPDSPGLYFKLAAATLPDLGQSAIYLVDGIETYGRSFWWLLSIRGLLIVSLLLSLLICVSILVLIKLPREIPRLVHDINETKGKLLIPLILIPVAFLEPVVFLGALVLLTGLYLERSDKWIVYIILLLMAGMPLFGQLADDVYTASSPETRALVAVNEGRDNSYDLKILKDKKGYEYEFSYATALKREGSPAEATLLFEDIVKEYRTAKAYINLGNAYFAAKDTESAKKAYKKAMDMDKNVMVLYNLSQAYRDSFDYALGDKYYEEAQGMDRQALGYYQEINGKSYNRTVIDARLSADEIMKTALAVKRTALPLAGDYKRTALGAIALLVLFVILDASIKIRAFRCTKCDCLACDKCSDPTHQHNDLLCSDCQAGQGVDEDISAKTRLAKMLAANEDKSRRVTRVRVLSIAPPGLAQVYSNRVGKAFIFMMFFVYPLVLLVMDPYFMTGLAGGSHEWLWFLALPVMLLDYLVSFVTVNRRLDKGWL